MGQEKHRGGGGGLGGSLNPNVNLGGPDRWIALVVLLVAL